MTDFFLVLTLPGAGDELQGIKKGVIEQADMVAVNKADVDPARARQAGAEYSSALRILTPASPNWTPPVVLVSGLANQGLSEMWAEIERHRAVFSASGELARKRARQQVKRMWALIEERLMRQVTDNDAVKARLPQIEREVADGALTPEAAMEQILVAAQRHQNGMA
jgi:LAO/AO transport system kinase